MLAEAIQKIIDISKPPIVENSGSHYSTMDLRRMDEELRAEALKTTTLSSLIDYISEFQDNDNREKNPYMIHIVSPTRVDLISALNSDRKREILMMAVADLPEFAFGRFMDSETFLISVQSKFVSDPNTHKGIVLKFAGTVTTGTVKDYGDDGVTQKATIRQGVASKTEAIVPSPCILAPYRTFVEVQQPASPFIFRMREDGDSVSCALFEADGGAWRNHARENIREYLEDKLEKRITIIS